MCCCLPAHPRSGRDRALDRLDSLDQDQPDHFHALVGILGLSDIRIDIRTRTADLQHLRVPDLIRSATVQADSERSKWNLTNPKQEIIRAHQKNPFPMEESSPPDRKSTRLNSSHR